VNRGGAGKTIWRLLAGAAFAAVIGAGLAVPVLTASGALSDHGTDGGAAASVAAGAAASAATSAEGSISAFVTAAEPDGDLDGLINALEPISGCIAGNPDSDGDGLTDGQEAVILGTNCNLTDSDGDAYGDDFEMSMTDTATGGGATTLIDTNSSYPQPPASTTSTWSAGQWAGFFVRVTGGAGAGQVREITGNTDTTLTVGTAWTTTPDASSTYSIQKVGTNPLLRCAADTIPDNEPVDASPPDINDDRSVNILDVFKMFPPWLSSVGSPAYDPRLDLNADGTVNILDVFEMFPAWGTSCA